MKSKQMKSQEVKERRKYGIHLTSKDIFNQYIYPNIKDNLKNHIWIDLYAGEGNLILPILNHIPKNKRNDFFSQHIFLFDIKEEMVNLCIENAKSYDITEKIAKQNIRLRDNLNTFPEFLKEKRKLIYHITNPPYLYLGYIKKHQETQNYLNYFKGENNGYQDLYQIAMLNDLRSGIENLIYIIPSNFLFGSSVSNKFRLDFLNYYKILKLYIFERKIFEFTGTNICIGFFKKKNQISHEDLSFSGVKIKKKARVIKKTYTLKYKYKYRAGYEFDEFLDQYRTRFPIDIKFYLLNKEVLKKLGNYEIEVIDANKYNNTKYEKLFIKVNKDLKKKINSNILYIKTVDTGSKNGRVGLSIIKDDFNVNGILVSGNTYRTHPIQLFFTPILPFEDQILLKDYFNFILEYFRNKLDSEFLTTYKYSNADYTRKYLGLTQTRRLIETFPHSKLTVNLKSQIGLYIKNNQFDELIKILNNFL